MKIELFYDPIRPETMVRINDIFVDATDMYGFLYPVRNMLLQTWLRPSASWTGLKKQIADLARGEETDLYFYGRQTDYADLAAALHDAERVTLHHTETDTALTYEKVIPQIEELLASLLRKEVLMEEGETKIYRSCEQLFPELVNIIQDILGTAQEDEWLQIIQSEQDYEQALASKYNCCVIQEAFLTSFGRLEALKKLTSSLRRSSDMLYCVFDSDDRMEEFRQYAEQFTDLKLHFVRAGDTEWKGGLSEKFGVPFEKRRQLSMLYHIQDALQNHFAQLPDVEQELRDIRKTEKKKADMIRREKILSFQKRWFSYQKPLFEKFTALLNHSYLNGGAEHE